jgi:hypothetical protein
VSREDGPIVVQAKISVAAWCTPLLLVRCRAYRAAIQADNEPDAPALEDLEARTQQNPVPIEDVNAEVSGELSAAPADAAAASHSFMLAAATGFSLRRFVRWVIATTRSVVSALPVSLAY